jgi:hypothetical protein
MSAFSSYSLKTLVMLMVRDRPDLTWQDSQSDALFLGVSSRQKFFFIFHF